MIKTPCFHCRSPGGSLGSVPGWGTKSLMAYNAMKKKKKEDNFLNENESTTYKHKN